MKSLALSCLFLFFSLALICQGINIMERPLQAERERDFDAIHYRIELAFDLDSRTFSGSNTIDLVPLQENFRIIKLDAVELIISSVENESGELLEYSRDSMSVNINLPQSFSPGENIRLKISYQGENPGDGLIFHERTETYPKMVESNSWPDHASYWYPCNDYPNDKATQEVIITVKKPYKVLSNGELVEIIDNGTTWTYHWYQGKPHSTYLSMLTIAPFSVLRDSLGELPVNYWVFEGDEANAARVFSITPDIIEFYNKIFDYAYPWAKYDQVIGPTQGGGAEATSATILGLGAIHDEDEVKDNNWKRIIAHEIAHQWWGDLITLRTWSETWMNEGFGTYSDYLYTEHFRGEPEASLDMEGKKLSYLNEAATRYMRPIVFTRYNRPQDNFDRHTYQKAAAVLHMLRSLIGDEDFFNTLGYFLHKHEFGSVDTRDFIICLQEVTEKNMDWFFDQWIYKPGHPVFDISNSWDDDAGTITLSVNQVQDTLGGVPLFRIPVRIGIYYKDGNTIFKDIWLGKIHEEFKWKLDSRPGMVRFDVGNIILKEWSYNKSFEELVFQVKSDDPIGRKWAIGQLAVRKDQNRRTEITSLLEKMAVNDPVWAVRLASLEGLVSINGSLSGEIILKAGEDPDQRVRNALQNIVIQKQK